eukprot:1157888-Pelagomonas_calceolata.AAC.3
MPNRIAALHRIRIVAIAAANKHSAAISASGDVYTWGVQRCFVYAAAAAAAYNAAVYDCCASTHELKLYGRRQTNVVGCYWKGKERKQKEGQRQPKKDVCIREGS